MNDGHRIAMLGTGLIGMFYTMTLHRGRGRDRVAKVYSRSEERARSFAEDWDVAAWTVDLADAIQGDDTDVVVIGIPNHLHEEAVALAAEAGKAILCTKPLGRNGDEALRMLRKVEEAGVAHGYLEDLVYTPKTLKALQSVRDGAIGQVLSVRSRECHPGPHSAWFWDPEPAGGGALIDLGCHCVEIIRSFIGKGIRPVEVVCWIDTLVHPIDSEDHGIALIRFENGAIGQFEVSWAFRGGMDLRDEVAGTDGTIWLDHFLRTGFEMFSGAKSSGYVAEKAESAEGWVFPVGDEVVELGYVDMFTDMLDALDEGSEPSETFYDGYVVNTILDACYRSAETKRWEPIEIEDWRGSENVERIRPTSSSLGTAVLIKRETMPDGSVKVIEKDSATGRVSTRLE